MAGLARSVLGRGDAQHLSHRLEIEQSKSRENAFRIAQQEVTITQLRAAVQEDETKLADSLESTQELIRTLEIKIQELGEQIRKRRHQTQTFDHRRVSLIREIETLRLQLAKDFVPLRPYEFDYDTMVQCVEVEDPVDTNSSSAPQVAELNNDGPAPCSERLGRLFDVMSMTRPSELDGARILSESFVELLDSFATPSHEHVALYCDILFAQWKLRQSGVALGEFTSSCTHFRDIFAPRRPRARFEDTPDLCPWPDRAAEEPLR